MSFRGEGGQTLCELRFLAFVIFAVNGFFLDHSKTPVVIYITETTDIQYQV
jgi:hypothetical protein